MNVEEIINFPRHLSQHVGGFIISDNEISDMILSAFPDATLELKDTMGDNNHFEAKIISKNFVGKSKIEQHKMVYKALKGKMGNELHALALTTEEKNG